MDVELVELVRGGGGRKSVVVSTGELVVSEEVDEVEDVDMVEDDEEVDVNSTVLSETKLETRRLVVRLALVVVRFVEVVLVVFKLVVVRRGIRVVRHEVNVLVKGPAQQG